MRRSRITMMNTLSSPLLASPLLAGAALALLFPATGVAQSPLSVQTPSQTEDVEEIEEIVVVSTRSRRRIQDEPLRVEVLSQEAVSYTHLRAHET